MQGKPTRFKTTSLIHCEKLQLVLGARLQHGNQLQLVLGSGCSTAISYSLEPGCSTAISCSWFWGQTAARQSAVVCGSGCSTAISYSWLGGLVAARQSSVICFGARLQNSCQLQFGAMLQHCNLWLVWVVPGCSTAISCIWFPGLMAVLVNHTNVPQILSANILQPCPHRMHSRQA